MNMIWNNSKVSYSTASGALLAHNSTAAEKILGETLKMSCDYFTRSLCFAAVVATFPADLINDGLTLCCNDFVILSGRGPGLFAINTQVSCSTFSVSARTQIDRNQQITAPVLSLKFQYVLVYWLVPIEPT